MKIIVAGDGKFGATLTRQLTAEGHDLTVIDVDSHVLDRSVERYDVMAVQGNCASLKVLRQAGAEDANLLIAATDADEVNLLCCMTAHGMNRDLHTIARIRSPEYLEQTYLMRDIFALSLTVNPEKRAATEIERLLRYPGFLKRDTFAKGRVEIVELRVEENSAICNQPLNRLNDILKCRILVCAVVRSGNSVAPDGSFVLRAGDRIFVTAPTDTIATLLKNLGIVTRPVNRVMVCGGGRISFYLAEKLQKSGIRVQIIEPDRERCVELASRLPQADIICGDARDESLLDSEGLDTCDAIVTVTGLDELNMVLSLYAGDHGVPQIVTKVGRSETVSVLGSLPLGSIVCPKDLACSAIVRYVRAMQQQAGAAVAVHSIADGQAQALEFHIDDSVQNCGKPLKELKIRSNTLICCITHGAQTVIPNGDSCFQKGDIVVVVTNGDFAPLQFNDIFA